ncbi:MAG: hypothetical protein ACE14M_13595 [Terriglobales bacterium]
MIDLIRQSAVPATIMRSAARGALSLPSAEMIEILVHLTAHPIFGPQARMTLAGWDEASSLAVVSDPQTPPAVLEYFLAPQNRRPRLIPALLENTAVAESHLLGFAQESSAELLSMMLASERVRASAEVLQALARNPQLSPKQWTEVQTALSHLEGTPQPVDHAPADVDDNILEIEVARYLRENASEISAAGNAPFQLFDWSLDEEQEIKRAQAQAAPPTAAQGAAGARTPAKLDDKHVSPMVKIARLTVPERIKLAITGLRDERFILIRDGARVVATAVLESPKLTEAEVELFASMKNVSSVVLRGIAANRKFIKDYNVVRALTFNPRCPIDTSLPLVKNLLLHDLKQLSLNKNVSDTVRRFAEKLYKLKAM